MFDHAGLFLRSAPEIRQTEVVGYFGEFSHYSLKVCQSIKSCSLASLAHAAFLRISQIQPYIGRPVINNTIYTIDDRKLTSN